jgi:lipopolysaccharide/colanic/teichoic acid biosynthesis glycosyltransferase
MLSTSVYRDLDRFEETVCSGTATEDHVVEMSESSSWSLPEHLRAQLDLLPGWKHLSSWSRSKAKRLFDFSCVLLSLPIVLPLVLVIGAVVRLTSSGPVFFLQKRVGLHGRIFTIFKFRTMTHTDGAAHHPIATATPGSECFTPVGPFLRRWKLDEIPQLLNVLLGHMSLVGPRPKMPEHVIFDLPCRPGITGMATTVFAREEQIFACIPKEKLEEYFHSFVLPAKRQLDVEYMACATFKSDFRLLVNSVLRRWDTAALEEFVVSTAFRMKRDAAPHESRNIMRTVRRMPMPLRAEHPVNVEEVSPV